MNLLNSKLYNLTETLSNLFILNVLWILFSLPIVTIFPSTTSMFAIIQEWKNGNQPSLYFAFIHQFQTHFKKSLFLGIIISVASAILIIDFFLLHEVNDIMRILVLSVLLFLSILIAFISVYLFPVIVHFPATIKQTISYSLLFSVKYFPSTLLSILLIIAVQTVVFFMPVLGLIAYSVTAYIIYTICSRNFQRAKAITF